MQKKYNLPVVSVVPYPNAGGSLSSAYYRYLKNPVVVEDIQADAGIDIGDTFIGMHLKKKLLYRLDYLLKILVLPI